MAQLPYPGKSFGPCQPRNDDTEQRLLWKIAELLSSSLCGGSGALVIQNQSQSLGQAGPGGSPTPADGFRITEDNNFRITEDGNFRIIE